MELNNSATSQPNPLAGKLPFQEGVATTGRYVHIRNCEKASPSASLSLFTCMRVRDRAPSFVARRSSGDRIQHPAFKATRLLAVDELAHTHGAGRGQRCAVCVEQSSVVLLLRSCRPGARDDVNCSLKSRAGRTSVATKKSLGRPANVSILLSTALPSFSRLSDLVLAKVVLLAKSTVCDSCMCSSQAPTETIFVPFLRLAALCPIRAGVALHRHSSSWWLSRQLGECSKNTQASLPPTGRSLSRMAKRNRISQFSRGR
jgi:hypothetical protein